MKTVTTTDAKARLHELLDTVAAGENVTITRHGKAIAVLSAPDTQPRRFGLLAGQISAPDDFDEPLDEDELARWEANG